MANDPAIPFGDTLMWPSGPVGAVLTKNIGCSSTHDHSRSPMFSCTFIGSAGGSRHGQHVEYLVELVLGDGTGLDVAALDNHLADGLAFGQRLLRDLGGLVVADIVVQRRHDRRRGLGVLAAALDVCF